MKRRNTTLQTCVTQESQQSKRQEELKGAIDIEIGQLHKTHALLVAVQFAANHDCDFDVSDALAVIRDRVEESIDRLDQAEVTP